MIEKILNHNRFLIRLGGLLVFCNLSRLRKRLRVRLRNQFNLLRLVSHVTDIQDSFIFHLSVSDFSFCRVFDTAAIIPKPITMITPMLIQIGEAPNLFAAQANPPVTKTIPIKYIAKLDI